MSKKKKKSPKGLQLRKIEPKTQAQERVFQAYDNDYNLVLKGCAGTGKTFLALFLALEDVVMYDSPRKLIKIFRSAVPTRDMGFMPGNITEKLSAYEAPYIAMVNELFHCGTASNTLKSQKKIEFTSTSYNRGITINNTVIIVDEAQNMTDHEISTIITRMGRNSRIIFCGDSYQMDLNIHREESGLGTLVRVASDMKKDFVVIGFEPDDIVRSDLIKRYLKTRIELGI